MFNCTFNSARAKLGLPRYVLKVKVIRGFDFEHQVNDFIKDKNVIDIKYSTSTGTSGYTFDNALVIYKEVE